MNVAYIACISALFLLLLINTVLLAVLWFKHNAGLRVTSLVAESLDRRVSLLEVVATSLSNVDHSDLMPGPCRDRFNEITADIALMPVPCRDQFDQINELLDRYDPPRLWVIDPTVNIPPCPSLDSSSACNSAGPLVIPVDSISQ